MKSFALPLAASLLWGVFALPSTAHACEAGYCVRSTVPVDGAQAVPVDARVFVYFDATPGLNEPQDGLTLVESASGQGVFASVEVFDGANPAAEVSNYVAVLEPLFGLDPNTTYEVTFAADTSVCEVPSLTFTTGDLTTTPPTFSGATGVTTSCIEAPAELSSCNDDSAFPRLHFTIEAAAAPDAAGYAVYREGERVAVVAELPAGAQLLPDEVAAEECFTVRALGANGVEDDNAVEVCAPTTDVCASAQGGEDMGTNADAGSADVGVSDDAGSPPDLGAPDAGGADTDISHGPSSDAGGVPDAIDNEAGCNCSTGPGPGAGLWWLGVPVGIWLRRRRRR